MDRLSRTAPDRLFTLADARPVHAIRDLAGLDGHHPNVGLRHGGPCPPTHPPCGPSTIDALVGPK